MRNNFIGILAALGLLLSAAAFGQGGFVNCASTTLAQTYSTSSPSLLAVFTNISAPSGGRLMIQNPTATTICATVTKSTSAPAAGNADEHCAIPNAIAAWDFVNYPYTSRLYVYLRARTTNCTAGEFNVDFWGGK